IEVQRKSQLVSARLHAIAKDFGGGELSVRGRGMMQGLACANPKRASAVARAAYRRGLVIETSGPHDEVIKCLCPLVIDEHDLERGLAILEESIAETFD